MSPPIQIQSFYLNLIKYTSYLWKYQSNGYVLSQKQLRFYIKLKPSRRKNSIKKEKERKLG